MLIDADLAWARNYAGSQQDPDDFDAFWERTLAEDASHPLDVSVTPVETNLTAIDIFDVTFAGASGSRVHGWLRVPAGVKGPLPAVVSYVGYGGGRGKPEESLLWAAAGFAHFQMDTRGQGSVWSVGSTADDAPSGPQVPGMMTRGIGAADTYYYRRLFGDAVRAVDVAKSFDVVDGERVAVVGGSQGGGLAIAVAGLRSDIAAVAAFVPFLCDFPRATTITDSYPYREIADYLKTHRDRSAEVHRVLSYFDAVNHAKRATAPAHVSVALMDPICPTSTVYAAYNSYAGAKEIDEWPYNGHEGGGIDDETAALAFFKRVLG